MLIHNLIVGPIRTNCYIIENNNGEAIVIDPGENAKEIQDLLRRKKLKLCYIILTHGHFDHVGANRELKERTGAILMAHENDSEFLPLSESPPADRYIKENEIIELGDIKLSVIHTPGHTPGGICLYSEKDKLLFSGDTLFRGTCGRVDLPYASETDMDRSLEKLMALPPETKVYPGHGEPTTIGDEKKLQPYED